MNCDRGNIYIGTSGWSYPHWKENFYPEGLKTAEWLNFYGSNYDTVEVNSTFYHLPLPSTIKKWSQAVPEHFLFSIKASRYITHQKRLHDCKDSLELFYRIIGPLKPKLGPILIQLPPSFQINKDRLLEFISLLDSDYYYTFEFRHPTWFIDDIYNILKSNNLALCITDLNGKLSPEEITADFTYIRLHGPKKAYQGSYGPVQLSSWKKKITKWSKETAVYCYFDNDEKGYAIQDAKYMKHAFEKGPKIKDLK